MATPKTTKKKAAKKTYPPTKKAVPKPKWMTAKELSVIMAEYQARMDARDARMDARHAKTEATIDKTAAEGRKTWEVLQETLRTVAETSAEVRELSKNLGRIGNDIGELTEYIVIPKIRHAMNAAGNHTFDSIQTDRLFKKIDDRGEKKTITEVDVLLFGETEIMAVETKACLMIRDVKKHLERLDILRQNEELVGIKGKPLLGAVVGAVVDNDVRNFALERGLYVAKIREEEEKLDIEKPETCRTW